MIEHFTLKDYPYKERRMDFFKQKRLEAKRRMNYWAKSAVNCRYNSIQHEKALDATDEFNFYNDIVVMLGGEDGESDDEKEL